MSCISRLAVRIATAGLLVAASATLAQEASFEVSGRYTAQRKPRVAVAKFGDANTRAGSERYGASVEAMMVTFLKRKSQLVVVERQNLGDIFAEWQRNQTGRTNLTSDDPGAQELLEKIDVFLVGTVTLLENPTQVELAKKSKEDGTDTDKTDDSPRRIISGPRIEIDAKLLSRSDGRIIAAAQRRGPVVCLRSIVERLGIELEQSFLRPYYGKLQFSMTTPDNVQIHLTPILLENALDEEKPPVEHGASVIVGGERDSVQAWVTNPTSYQIDNILSGWYSLRLTRPGYRTIEAENARWVARNQGGKVRVYDQVLGKPLEQTPASIRRFVVRVDPLSTEDLNGEERKFTFEKKSGSIAPRARRQFLDPDFKTRPRRVLLYGDKEIEINGAAELDEYAEDETCDLFEEKPPTQTNRGTTYVAAGQIFSIDTFAGGKLLIEDYQGEELPAGRYKMTFWEPDYELLTSDVNIQDQDREKIAPIALPRSTVPVILATTGPRPRYEGTLNGTATGHQIRLPLNFASQDIRIPVDTYTAATAVPGLNGWQGQRDFIPVNSIAPVFDLESDKIPPIRIPERKDLDQGPVKPPVFRVKTRFVVGGRLNALSALPRPKEMPEELYIDHSLPPLLDRLLPASLDEDEDENPGFWRRLFSWGRKQKEPDLPVSSAFDVIGAVEEEQKELEALLQDFTAALKTTDLLVLSDTDMARLRRQPEAAAVVSQFVADGGALFAFISKTGEYSAIVGSPLSIETGRRKTARFDLVRGDVSGITLAARKKRVRVKSRRALPEAEAPDTRSSWRVVAYGRNREGVRILERGTREGGGYVAVWCDQPDSFRTARGRTVPQIEAARTEIERHILSWARYLMYRRYDTTGTELRKLAVTP
jgi:hypothetical protein